ncbi:hypothetical protein Q4574_06435 [Aliiglaciecola sp. 3_MG-2023]|uniref:hypothetical protein n=1 Tax=Aliiglaciecola sp. 3_MG-2023 TaxID=3062644 RepID=UPI0026E21D1C|nr:hypothetical protein [Aliiglaciecola sp. 3_MG-2023]MDO6692913.1 hypothetical protein [Aliiglaciecola sp. 3_MG-2023]
MRKFTLKNILICFCTLLPMFSAQAYLVGGPNSSLQTSNSGYSWDGGSFITDFRNALENPLFFGAGGVVNESITTMDIIPDAAGLAGVDGFIAPWWNVSESSAYHADVVDFFLNGGDLWLMQDSSGRDGIGALLGIPTVGQTAITPVNGIEPLFDGPFGVANNVTQGGGEEGFLSTADVLNANGSIIGMNTENQVIAAAWGAGQYAAGSGSLIVVADIDMFTTQAQFNPLNDNGIFALNAFAFLATSDEPIGVPNVPTLMFILVGIGLIRVCRKK